jgi:hypothetical protein
MDIAPPVGHPAHQPHRAWAFVADEFLDARHRHRADGGVDRREKPAETDKRDRAQQRG